MYNIDRKERFLKDNYSNEGTQKGIRLTFNKIESLEEQFGADLSDFNRNQILDVFALMDCTTTASLDKEWSKVKKYIEWCAAEGYSLPNLALGSIYKKDLIKYINKSAHENLYIKSRQEFYEYLKLVYNPQEQAIPVLLYEGISGRPKQEYSFEEIKNLKSSDVYQDKVIVTRNDGTFRILNDIDQRSMDIIFAAINQTEYYKGNGLARGKNPISTLQDTPYVIRTIERKDNTEGISTVVIDVRIRNFKKWTKLYWLNAKNLFFSGMFDRLQNRELNGELTKEDYEDVVVRFGMGKNKWGILKEKYQQFKEILQD